MNYFLDLVTPETWQRYCASSKSIAGFRTRQKRTAYDDVKPGDYFICYLTQLSRWCGVLRVASSAFEDSTPIHGDPDPFTVRFRVDPLVTLDYEHAVPIHTPEVWHELSLTKKYPPDYPHWTGPFRKSLYCFNEEDGRFLVELLDRQKTAPKTYSLTPDDERKLKQKTTAPTPRGSVEVEIPEDEPNAATDSAPLPSNEPTRDPQAGRDSIRVQAKVAEIGTEMGFHVWVPSNDRNGVLKHMPVRLQERLIERLPLNYEENTLRTIQNIDVIWLRGRSMVRAFEIEHTTAIYSGLLRMADLLALQPNMDIRLSIVAPEEKREKVMQQIKRPVFSLLERGPLYKQCSFVSYDSIERLSQVEHLTHMNDSIIEDYEDFAEV